MSEKNINSNQIMDSIELNRLNGNGIDNNSSLLNKEMLHVLQNCSNLLCIATDTEGVICSFSAGAELSLGFKAAEVISKISLADICDSVELMKRNEEINSEFETCINPGFDTIVFIASQGIEDYCALTYISKIGSHVHVEVSVNASFNDSGKLLGYLIIGTERKCYPIDETDETNQKEISRKIMTNIKWAHSGVLVPNSNSNYVQLNHAIAEVETLNAQNQAKSVFLANMSHEIRNPLNAIIGFADILHDNLKDVVHINQVDAISKSGKILLHLLNEILDLSKIEAGKMTMELEPVNLNILFSDLEMMYSQNMQDKGLLFKVAQDPDLNCRLMLDEHHLRQILMNLIGNALKFTEEGSISLKIQKVFKHKKLIDLIISISDTGIGIALDEQELIFEPFHQQEGQKKKKFGGTGLGLSISKKLAKMMDGEIIVTSEPGNGSIFQVILHNVEIHQEKSLENLKSVMGTFSFKGTVKLKTDKIVSNAIAFNRIAELTDAQRSNWVKVINVLESEFLPLNKSVIKRKLIEQIEYFGKGLILFGEVNIFQILTDYGSKICLHVDNFEIDKMMKTLKLFPGIINKIKSMNQNLITS